MKQFKTIFLFLIILYGCEVHSGLETHEKLNEISSVKNLDFLVFKDQNSFQAILSQEEKNDMDFLKVLKGKIYVPENFRSLKEKIDKDEEEFDVDDMSVVRLYQEENLFISPDSISELIPDIRLREVLNEKLEIQIGDVFYKITPYGTFFCESSKIEPFKVLIETKYSYNKYDNGLNEDSITEITEIEEGIFFYPTFKNGTDEVSYQDVDLTNANVGIDKIYQYTDFGPMPNPYPYAFPVQAYDSFRVHNYGANTAVGKMIEGIGGGTNNGYMAYWGSAFRLKVKLYAFNYVFYQAAGLNAKMQKKGWTGIWAKNNGVKADKLVVGWDAMIFSIKNPYPKPLNSSSLPFKGVAREVLEFTNFSLVASTVSDFRIPFLNIPESAYTSIEKGLKKMVEKKLSDLTKEIWEEAQKEFANQAYELRNEHHKAYRKAFPEETKLVIGRFEHSANNSNEINLVFDRNYEVWFGWNPATVVNFVSNVLIPSIGKNKKLYNIDAASVYGASHFLYETKGVRIVKELN